MSPHSKARPDYPIEAANGARHVAQAALAVALTYLLQPEGSDRGRAFPKLVEPVQSAQARLEGLDPHLQGHRWDTAVDPEVLAALKQADQVLTDIIAMTSIEDVRPRLHGPQEDLRARTRIAEQSLPS